MFIKLQKTGGGVLHASCMHSVVYYCSPLWWQESARDHTDGLLSFKIPPTIYISDVAGRVARHTNNRTAQQFFQPNDGRLISATPENISKASQGKIHFNFSWVKFLTQPGGPVLSMSKNPSLQSPHPVTRTADRFSLYDRFHQRNQKRPEEKLRSLELLPDLANILNSSLAEQLNKELANSRYFLCQLKDFHYMFMLRLVFHLHNQRINLAFFSKMQKQTDHHTDIGCDGRITLFGTFQQKQGPMGKKPYPLAGKKETEGQEKISCSEKDGKQRHKFSLMLFPTEPQNKDKLLELHKKVKDRKHLLVKFGLSGASLEDLRSLLPPEYLTMEHDAPTAPLPWLTDDVVNCRIAQLAQGNEKVKILPTYVFVCWWRDWHTLLQISDRTLEWSLKDMQSQCTVLFPRCVGGKTPEKGNHFILWVFDGAHKEIRIYDSMQYHSKIDKTDMEILS
ncbi:uncharacterized protein [Paramormyrops kingsleyae]|uniref:uncharacterized protein n=1 Tax=Paramormyrops kingsleyae TaxID=1676925 RepID=UPI003B97CF60